MNSPIDKLKFSPDPFNITSQCNCDICAKRREIAAALGVPVEAVQAIAVMNGISMPVNFGPVTVQHFAPTSSAMPAPPNPITAFDVGGPADRPGAVKPSSAIPTAVDEAAALEAEIKAYGLPRALVGTAKVFAKIVCSIYVAWTFASVTFKRFVLGRPLFRVHREDQ